MKKIAIIGGSIIAVVFIALIVVLFRLGGKEESSLERLRDIAIILNQLFMFVIVILLSAITAALFWLVIKVKDQVVPLLDEGLAILREFKGTANRVQNTTSFVTEEAVKPIMTAAGQYAKIRKMGQIVSGKSTAKVDPPTFKSTPK
ncbi:MAG: hypothetical protein M9934_02170 [Thermomicrobiales bacterium]|nr:hypothetical protein [Thermomicrobiales bacterium]MCO5218354.1 hypothetical protein [Thermomicrobiales bacterium]MCO5227076.1 hypothetical protein [Thermomicrobiales bacterium]